MARFQEELPYDVIKSLDGLEKGCEEMFGKMCKAAAQVVFANVKTNMKKAFKSTKSLDKGLKITRVYKTPSDDGINVHVGFYGYNDKGVPIPLIANAREYGTSRGERKKPFFRISFKKAQIEAEMKKVQDEYIKE